MKKSKTLSLIGMAAFLCLLIVMVVQLFPVIEDVFYGRQDESSIVEYIDSFGWRGVPALIGLSALQVIIPLIPAPVVGVVAGLTYGIYLGPFIFLFGIAVGNIFVVVSVRQLGSLLTSRAKQKPKHGNILSKERLEKIKRPEIVVFFLFMIPFLSGVGPYLFAKTKIPLLKYIIAVIAGSIPSTVMYVFLGDRISRGNHTTAIVIAIIAVAVILIALLFRKKIIEKIMRESYA